MTVRGEIQQIVEELPEEILETARNVLKRLNGTTEWHRSVAERGIGGRAARSAAGRPGAALEESCAGRAGGTP